VTVWISGRSFFMLDLLIITIVAIALDALVSACEAAILAVPQSRVLAARVAGKRGAAALERLKHDIQRPLAVLVILSNIITIIAASIFGAVAIQTHRRTEAAALLIAFTILVIIFAEVVPKIVGARRAEGIALASTGFLRLMARLFDPLIRITYFIGTALSPEKSARVSEEEIEAMATLGASAGSIEPDEAAMIRQVFQLNDITAGDLMTPRRQVFYLEGEKTLAESKPRIIAATHSRIPVTSDHYLEKIVGVVHQRDLLIALENGHANQPVKSFAKKPLLVPEGLPADELLRAFQKARTHLALVISDHGEVSGVVTLEDCIEELVGEIIDEKDVVPDLIKRVKRDEIIAHGETRGRHVNSFFQSALPETKTLTGFLQDEFQRVPEKNELLVWKNLEFRIEEAAAGQIERIRITRIAPNAEHAAGAADAPP
jgi:CBS domain containing-hemolysin-like protein